jgi:hypothetical protein
MNSTYPIAPTSSFTILATPSFPFASRPAGHLGAKLVPTCDFHVALDWSGVRRRGGHDSPRMRLRLLSP